MNTEIERKGDFMKKTNLFVNRRMAASLAVVGAFVVTSGAIALASNMEGDEELATEDTYIAGPAETMMAIIETDETLIIFPDETVENELTEEPTETTGEENEEETIVEENTAEAVDITVESEPTEIVNSEEEEETDFSYDAEGYWYDGWWVPSITLNGDGTASCYLEDGTEFDSFYVGDFAVDVRVWQATSIDNYADYLYGSVGRQNMPSDRYESFMVLDSYVWSLT